MGMFKLVHYDARTVGKQAVGILLECCIIVLCPRTFLDEFDDSRFSVFRR